MKNKIIASLIFLLLVTNSAFADMTFVDPSDFTGDAFFTPPMLKSKVREAETQTEVYRTPTTPPLKSVRLLVKKKLKERELRKYELAPIASEEDKYAVGTETSKFASQEIEENFDDNIMPDGFEADEQSVREHRKSRRFWKKKEKGQEPQNAENIILDCENMDYDTDTYCLVATGNVNVEFIKQQTVIKADTITYDRMNNTIKAEGNVQILKNGQTITGDYIFVDMNEENALIENPVTQTSVIEIRSKKGYVYSDKIVQENGSLMVSSSFPLNLAPTKRGPQLKQMLLPNNETLTSDMNNGLVKFKVKDIKIRQNGELEVITLKKATIFKGERTILKIPALKVYTNKNHDFAETGSWELGSYRGLGMFMGPGFVIELPKGSVLKAMPILNYNHKIGVGGIGRFQNGTNMTQVAYGTAKSKFLVRGKQRLDDNLYLQYGMNDYMDEWFLGRRRPKYGLNLVYENAFSDNNFLIKGQESLFSHRVDIGYYHDIDEDKNFGALRGPQIGTLRTRYMAQANQNLYNFVNPEKQTALALNIAAQLSASLYGTGDTQVIGRIGPYLHSQYKRWMQDIGYFQATYEDNSPIPVFDAYRYGKSSVYIREYLRLNRYLTVSWFGSINLSGDSPNDRPFQENSFYISVGPDDVKLSLGYDFIRETTYFMVELMMDCKGASIDYDRLEIKQDKKAQKQEEQKEENEFQNAKSTPILQHAVVEDVKVVEDVI